MALVLILITILIFLLAFYLHLFSKGRPKFFPPGPPRLPFWGSYWFLLKEDYQYTHLACEKLGKKYNTDILGFYLGDYPTIVPLSYDLCKEVLVRDEFAGRNDTIITRMRGIGAPRGIFFMDGPIWKEQRRFSLSHLRDFGFGRRFNSMEDFIAGEVKLITDLLMDEPSREHWDINPSKGVALMPDLLYGSCLNAMFLVLASTTLDYFELREYARAGLRFQRSNDSTGQAISLTPWLVHIAPEFFGYNIAERENAYMLNFLQKIVEEHRRTFSDDHHRDFIDVYLSEQLMLEGEGDFQGFTDEQLLLTLLDYTFPAAIAIGHTMNFYIANLINNPRVQKKIQEEIDRVVGRSRFPNLDDRKLMPYTEASIREGIRISPINPLSIPRRCMEETVLRGYVIPKDTIIMPSVWTAHRDPQKFGPNVESFIPERFLDADGNLLKKDYTLGFGAGKRLCAGETFARHTMFLITTGILQNFTIKAANGRQKIDLTKIIPGVNVSIADYHIEAVCR